MKLPTESILVKNNIRNIDSRGNILSIVDGKISNVSIINCSKDSIRSNHYHKKDFHFMHVLEGKIHYFFKNLKTEKVKYILVNTGDNIFTPKKEIHATFFPVNTKLIVSSGFPRDQKTYEEDTVRVNFVTYKNIDQMLLKYADK